MVSRVIVILLGISAVGALALFLGLRSSLPTVDGQLDINFDAASTITLNRDNKGIVSIEAANQRDAMFSLGFAHAQDRFFQMDMLRKRASGRLSEVVGNTALALDKTARFYQFEALAERILEQLPQAQQDLLAAYSAGVNEALAKQNGIKYEYVLTGLAPMPWQPSDSLLVIFNMYLDLQGREIERDLALTQVQRLFGDDMVDFLTQPSTYQAAIDNSYIRAKNIGDLPSPVVSADQTLSTQVRSYQHIEEPAEIGSSSWAVMGYLTDSRRGMLSNDMHLGLRVPLVWYHAQLHYQHQGKAIHATGLTLPGAPAMVVGATDKIAWGFTNAYIDSLDWVRLDPDTPITTSTHTIKIKDQASHEMVLETSPYGPVRRIDGQAYALQWVALQPYAVNLGLADLIHADGVADALQRAQAVKLPVQNTLFVDDQGHIAYRLMGAVARRTSSQMVAVRENTAANFDQPEMELPIIVDPPMHRLWTANARVLPDYLMERYGDGGYAVGARQVMVRNALFEHERDTFSETDFFTMQFTNDALFLDPWHLLLEQSILEQPDKYANVLSALEQWQACACETSIGYTLVRRWRSAIINSLMDPIEQTLRNHGLSSSAFLNGIEPAIWDILEEQPRSWLPNNHSDYYQFQLAVLDQVLADLIAEHDADPVTLAGLEWGRVNQLEVKHPFSSAIGGFAGWFNMKSVAGHGDRFMPAVQSPAFGASNRFVVQPGKLETAILSLPGGQSEHFLSPFYRSHFNDFAKQQPTPLLPGEPKHRLRLVTNGAS